VSCDWSDGADSLMGILHCDCGLNGSVNLAHGVHLHDICLEDPGKRVQCQFQCITLSKALSYYQSG
jgi:hypothetical protein